MNILRIIQYVYFFSLLTAAGYLLWLLVAPFWSALALSVVVATVCYPLFEKILHVLPRLNRSLASLLTVLVVILVVFLPLVILGSFIVKETASVYAILNNSTGLTITHSLEEIESFVQQYIPTFTLDISLYAEQAVSFITQHLLGIFTGTATTLFLFFIALIGLFYFFRDGRTFISYLVHLSPLDDEHDARIMYRMGRAVRSVVLGTVLVALIQGVLTAIGLTIFGFDRAVLWGSIAAIGALIPGVGTTIVFVPAIIYSVIIGNGFTALGVLIWAVLAVGLIDNLLGPYLMSRGNTLHPFGVLISVLGGIALFGPIGFILGPVILSFFMVLVELCAEYLERTSNHI